MYDRGTAQGNSIVSAVLDGRFIYGIKIKTKVVVRSTIILRAEDSVEATVVW